jgi:putative transposase
MRLSQRQRQRRSSRSERREKIDAPIHFGLSITQVAPSYLIMDMDAKFTAEFRETRRQDGIEPVRVGNLKPNLNAFAERFVQTIEADCLDHFVAFGLGHLQHLVREFVQHYNRERPHQGVGNCPLPEVGCDSPPTLQFPSGEVVCEERLGGLLKHYRRAA